jgi:DNA repair protein RecO (recombination protein O)
MAGFYLNDLLLRLVSRGDSNPEIFDAYRNCLNRLATGVQVARAVRMFELCLLSALGYRVELERDVRTGEALRPELTYAFEFESGPSVSSADRGEEYLGAQLISLRDGVLDDQDSLRAAKRLLGKILRSYLGERPLNSRNVLREMAGRGFGRDLATTKQ